MKATKNTLTAEVYKDTQSLRTYLHVIRHGGDYRYFVTATKRENNQPQRLGKLSVGTFRRLVKEGRLQLVTKK